MDLETIYDLFDVYLIDRDGPSESAYLARLVYATRARYLERLPWSDIATRINRDRGNTSRQVNSVPPDIREKMLGDLSPEDISEIREWKRRRRCVSV